MRHGCLLASPCNPPQPLAPLFPQPQILALAGSFGMVQRIMMLKHGQALLQMADKNAARQLVSCAFPLMLRLALRVLRATNRNLLRLVPLF